MLLVVAEIVVVMVSVPVVFLIISYGDSSSTSNSLSGDCPMFRIFYVQKIFVFRRANVQKVLCLEGTMFRKYLFKRFYVQKVLYSDIFRRSYIQKILCFM